MQNTLVQSCGDGIHTTIEKSTQSMVKKTSRNKNGFLAFCVLVIFQGLQLHCYVYHQGIVIFFILTVVIT